MPSFAQKFINAEPQAGLDMAGVFPAEGVNEILEVGRPEVQLHSPVRKAYRQIRFTQSLKRDARSRAQEIIRSEIPAYLRHLNEVLQFAKDDPSSPLWKGHLNSGPFVKENVKLIMKSQKSDRETILQQGSPTGTPTIIVEQVDKFPSLKELKLTIGEPTGQVPGGCDNDDDDCSEDGGLDGPGHAWQGGLPPNEICDKLMDMIEQESEKAIVMGKELLHWIRLEIPTIEDGNNFGVDVQEEILNKIEGMCGSACKNHTLPKTHYEDRMKFAQSWNKYPNLEDHAAAIASSDRFDFFLAHNAIMSLRNNMSTLLLALQSNWPKVHNPKSNNGVNGTSGLY
ncbi:hypothetical protein QFC22_006440 [Naganishia vaughanmartiniae]|uniref:Uncharacterized protein n=1 Tax=Naganishia vaughanmartiniae TaxID=1424756 RepID=A0ACC2WL03_9TREE|nr:hypothetical protein QFC22_006440 [Naganishia vaughanmartiniae]